jgi:hypothetical protein
MLNGRKKNIVVRPDGYQMPHAFSWELNLDTGFSDQDLAGALLELLEL